MPVASERVIVPRAAPTATRTFLDHLPWDAKTFGPAMPPRLPEVGFIIQLLVLRGCDGERALETELGIPVPPRTDPAERFLLSGKRLLEAARASFAAGAPHGLESDLFRSVDGSAPRVEIGDFVSLQRRWSAASNAMRATTRTRCTLRPGVVLLGALRVRSPDLASLATLLGALDRTAADGLTATDEATTGVCQLDVLAVLGGVLDALPTPASLVHTYGNSVWTGTDTPSSAIPWAEARCRLDGRAARRAASLVTRHSPLAPYATLPG